MLLLRVDEGFLYVDLGSGDSLFEVIDLQFKNGFNECLDAEGREGIALRKNGRRRGLECRRKHL